MDNTPPIQPTLDSLRTVEFRMGLKGYNVEEVDEYLENAAMEADAVQEQLRQITEHLRQANERISQLEAEVVKRPAETGSSSATDESLQRTLTLAERVLDQIKQEAEGEAAATVAQATERARALIEKAEEEARNLQHESEQRLRAEVTRLETSRAQLANDVENMARHLESERNRLHGTLGDMLKWVEEHFQPAHSLMAVHKSSESGPSVPLASGGLPASDHERDPGGGTSGQVAQVLDLHGGSGAAGPSAQHERG